MFFHQAQCVVPALVSSTTVTPIDGSLQVFGWDHENWCRVLAIGGSSLEVQEIVLYSKLLLVGSIEMFFVLRSDSGEILGQCPSIPPRPFDPINYGGDNWVSPLSFYPVEVGKVSEVLMLPHDLSVPDYHLLVHSLTLFYHVYISRLSPRLMRCEDVIE